MPCYFDGDIEAARGRLRRAASLMLKHADAGALDAVGITMAGHLLIAGINLPDLKEREEIDTLEALWNKRSDE